MRNFHKKNISDFAQKNSAKLIAFHAQKQRKSSQKNARKQRKFCAKDLAVSWKPYRKFKLKTNLGKKKMSRNFLNENLLKGNFPSGNNYGIRTDGSHTENFDLFEVPYRLLSSWGKMYCRQQS